MYFLLLCKNCLYIENHTILHESYIYMSMEDGITDNRKEVHGTGISQTRGKQNRFQQ